MGYTIRKPLLWLALACTSVSDIVNASPILRGVNETSPTVDLGYATYRGTALPTGVSQYLGMRYAAPPTGNLRFRAPEKPANSHTGIQDATEFGALCLGSDEEISASLTEDCLFVNVFTPTNATASSRLPVWIYIQGGGYAADSNGNYNGTEVIARSGYDMVFVNFNYRVGAFGFLASEEVQRNGDLNVGLLDQQEVFRWVQKYIHLFGGDPDHVVIHGTSAGAGSVSYHLTAYGGQQKENLFAAAIGESVFWPTHRTVAETQFQYDRLVANTTCANATDTLSCLRSLPLAELQATDATSWFPGALTDQPDEWYFVPVIDGTFSTDYLYNLYRSGSFLKVPVIFGDDTNEGTFFAYNATNATEVADNIKNYYPQLNREEVDTILEYYPGGSPTPYHAAYFAAAAAAYGDATFTCPGNFIMAKYSLFSDPSTVWNYRVNIEDELFLSWGFGVPHTFETPAIFGVGYAGDESTASSIPGASFATYNAAIVPVAMDYWISFVKYLDPNPGRFASAPTWDNFGTGTGSRLKLQTNATAMEDVPLDQVKKCDLWWSLGVTMEQ